MPGFSVILQGAFVRDFSNTKDLIFHIRLCLTFWGQGKHPMNIYLIIHIEQHIPAVISENVKIGFRPNLFSKKGSRYTQGMSKNVGNTKTK